MSRLILVLIALISVLGSSLQAVDTDDKGKSQKAAYVAPYGLAEADLGEVKAPRFLAAVLGKGTEAEQNAALAVFTSGKQESYDEFARLSDMFKRKSGVQSAVWRETRTGKLKRAGDSVRFDPDRDRIELVFARLDVRAVQAQAAGANPVTAASRAWVAEIVKAEKKNATAIKAVHALPGVLGGSGDFKSGNIVPLYEKAKQGVKRAQDFPIIFAQDLVTMDTVVLVLVAYEYTDKTSRIPSRVRIYWATGKSAGGRAVENNDQ
jgi:hypothetical protein